MAAATSGTNITITVPYGTDVTDLAPTYTICGASCDPPPGSHHNFTSPVHYIVTASDSSTKDFAVTVTVSAPPILVGASGSGSLTFDTVPTIQEWSTLNVGGAAADIADAAGLDSMVQTYLAANISTALGSSGFWPPGANNIARRNTGANNGGNPMLQLRPSSTKAVVLMARLFNESGGGINGLTISYNFDAPVTGNAEEVPGLRVYYSLTGLANSWTVIPTLCTATAGTLTANVTLSSPWANANAMYVLWVVDNNAATDNAYTIDDVSFAAATIPVPIPTLSGITVGPEAGQFTVQLSTDSAGNVVTVMTPSLTPPIVWTPVQTNAVPGGAVSITLPQGTGQAAFFKLMLGQ